MNIIELSSFMSKGWPCRWKCFCVSKWRGRWGALSWYYTVIDKGHYHSTYSNRQGGALPRYYTVIDKGGCYHGTIQ